MFQHMFRSIAVIFALAFPAAHLMADQNLPDDPYTYTWHKLAAGVWSGVRENGPQVPVMGTSTFVVGEDGVVVFDGKNPSLKKIQKKYRK